MGYTHYFKFKDNKIPAKAFDAIVKDVKVIEQYFKDNIVHSKNAGSYFKEHRVTLHDGWGKRNGILYTIEEIGGKRNVTDFTLNGTEKGGLEHETLYLKKGEQEGGLGGFCKTARKPYDLAVTMILMSVQYHLNTAKIGSDGYIKEWKHAIQLWKKIFKERIIEVAGLTKENPDLYIVRLEKKLKPMILKKELV